jgi:lipopolysaccharide export system permease protein
MSFQRLSQWDRSHCLRVEDEQHWRRNIMDIIDRAIIKQFLVTFFGAILVFATLFTVVDASSRLLPMNPSTNNLLSYYAYYLPAILYQMIPVASVLATVFTLSGMSKSNEIVALYSLGRGLVRISAPVLVGVLVISLAAFWVSDQLLPSLNQRADYVLFVDIQKKPGLIATVKTNRIWFRSKNHLFNLQTFNPDTKRGEKATFYTFDETWNLVQVTSARILEVEGKQWKLIDGSTTLFAEESSFPLTQQFKTRNLNFEDTALDVTASTKQTEAALPVQDLKRYIEKNRAAGLDTLRYEVAYYSKFAFAFAGFVMCFIAFPFAVTLNRSGGKGKNIGITLGLVFLYWALFSSGLALGKHGTIPPLAAAWAANILMAGLGGVFLLRRGPG